MPIFRFPFFYNHNYYSKPFYPYTQSFTNNRFTQNKYDNSKHNSNYKLNIESEPLYTKSEHCSNGNDDSRSFYDKENYFFELFGLKLFFDDILLLCLIFFLYQEGVRDDELFLSLVLLLLS